MLPLVCISARSVSHQVEVKKTESGFWHFLGLSFVIGINSHQQKHIPQFAINGQVVIAGMMNRGSLDSAGSPHPLV